MKAPTATFYEANAGTGKTTRLTGYILEAVEKGMALERICALTFTQKAANEMLDRLRSRVAELVSAGLLDPQQMHNAGKCFIGTIHSFCLQLVKRYASDLPIPPIFEIDPQEEKFDYLFENRWDEYLSRLLLSEAPEDQAIIRSLGVTALRSLAEILVKSRQEFHKPDDDNVGWLVDDLANRKRWNMRNGTWPAFASQLIPDYEAHRNVLSAITQRKNIRPPYATWVRDLLACKTDQLYFAISLLQSGFVWPFLTEYHASGNVRYDDLLIFTRRLLTNQKIRSEMKERYDLLLVDEMQDTDAVQYEIILYLCEKQDVHQNFTLREIFQGARKVDLQQGKLFVVGDPKQSIYGFRNADLSAYDSIKNVLVQTGAEIIPLTDNYRSCPNLVDLSNRLASALFPGMQPRDSNAARADLCQQHTAEKCIHFVRLLSPDSDRSHLRILSEANWIARKIKELVDSNQAVYKDFGVLLRKLVNSHLYVDAFAALDIPVIVEGERFFYRSQEVIDFINLLKYIVDPMDELALAGMLRSPLFGLTDREMAYFFLTYRKNGRNVMEAMSASLDKTKVSEPMTLMERIFEIRKSLHLLSPARLIETTLEKIPALAVAGIAYGSDRETVAPLNILRIHKYAAELEQDPSFNLFHFVSVLSSFSREGKERGQEPLADEGLDAVRMMSIHNSKGLDFPIVFVPLTDYETRGSSNYYTDVLHDWATDTAGLKVSGITEANYLRLRYARSQSGLFSGDEPIEMEDEEKRVLYVAATRAKRQIYFCCLEKGSGKAILDLLQNVHPFVGVAEEACSASLGAELRTENSKELEPFQPVLQKWMQVRSYESVRSAPLISSITREAEKVDPGEEEWRLVTAAARRSTATLVGLLCHGVLEKLTQLHMDAVPDLLLREAGRYSQTYNRDQMQRALEETNGILRNFLASPCAAWLRSVEVIGREVPVTYFDRKLGRVLSGKLDLLCKDNGKYRVVDYKTDTTITPQTRKKYEEQLALYMEALKESLDAPLAARLILVRSAEIIDL